MTYDVTSDSQDRGAEINQIFTCRVRAETWGAQAYPGS